MDNNFNAQQPMGQPMQQPMGQPMQQPMYQQPMGQPMQQPMYNPMYQQPMGQPMYNPMYQQPKKSNKGLIIGIIAAVSVLLIAIVTIVLVLVLGGGDKGIIGSWESENGITMTLEKDNTGTMGEDGMSLPITWKKSGDTLTVTISYMGMSETQELTIVKLSGKTMILADESGDEEKFTKK